MTQEEPTPTELVTGVYDSCCFVAVSHAGGRPRIGAQIAGTN
jgi:hypothetical protein